MAKINKKIKSIKIDADKCNGCRGCELHCSFFHAEPKYSEVNPAKARIKIIRDQLRDIWLPVLAGEYTPAECMGRDKYIIDGKEYEECSFCRATCPSRERFFDPDSALPLKCDMCEGEDKPKCVEWCLNDVLIYEEREEEVDEVETIDDMEIGLQALVDKHGLQTLVETITRMTQKE